MNNINMYVLNAKEAKFDRAKVDAKCKRCNLVLSKAQTRWCWLPELCGKSRLTTLVVSGDEQRFDTQVDDIDAWE